MTQTKLEKLLQKWAIRLRLVDWEISIKFVPVIEGLTAPEHASAVFGGTMCKPTFMQADIQIRAGLSDSETELTLVHELLHVRFGGMAPPEGLYDHLFEVGIEMTARCLMDAYENT
jgi:hypothetical protein